MARNERSARAPGKRPLRVLSVIVVAVLVAAAAISNVANGESTRKGNLQVSFEGGLKPRILPRDGQSPISVFVSGRIKTVNGNRPPLLRAVSIEVNSLGSVYDKGLPICPLKRLTNTTTDVALARCGPSKVGRGRLTSKVALPDQTPLPGTGEINIFKGEPKNGTPTLLAHVYGSRPLPATYVFVFSVKKQKGTFGTVLTTHLPKLGNRFGFLTYFGFSLRRHFHYKGKSRSYLNAGCPAPKGVSRAIFPMARVSYSFDDGSKVSTTLTRDCIAKN